MVKLKDKIPWPIKIISKLILARIPVEYSLWKRIDLFRHGRMEDPQYAYNVFKTHFDRVDFAKKKRGFVALELGPGDSLSSGIIAKAFGASKTYLVDVGAFAQNDLQSYNAIFSLLKKKRQLTSPSFFKMTSIEDMLSVFGIHYETNGIESLRQIPDQSVDFIWSQAVLEHIKRDEFFDTLIELRRIITLDGACSHQIDLRDHLGGALNNLRFNENIWKSNFMVNSGFYTNRIRYGEMLLLFKKGGFEVEVVNLKAWKSLPTPKKNLAAPFKYLPDEDLCVSVFDVVLKPKRQNTD